MNLFARDTGVMDMDLPSRLQYVLAVRDHSENITRGRAFNQLLIFSW